MPEYDGEEKRDGYCPVHHLKCRELTGTGEAVKILEKEKLSIKMFKIFLGIAIIAVGFLNVNYYRANQQTLKILHTYIDENSKTLERISHVTSETAINQKTVMQELKLQFQTLPDYRSNRGSD